MSETDAGGEPSMAPETDAPERHPGGRPPKYDPSFAEQARKLCNLGATDAEIANFFEVSVRTIYSWKLQHDEFLQALKRGKDEYDDLVEKRLFSRAVGYSQDAVKIFMPAGADEPVYAPYTEHVPPDVTAAIFWLKNRRPDQWRDRKELTGADGTPLVPVLNLTYGDGGSRDQSEPPSEAG